MEWNEIFVGYSSKMQSCFREDGIIQFPQNCIMKCPYFSLLKYKISAKNFRQSRRTINLHITALADARSLTVTVLELGLGSFKVCWFITKTLVTSENTLGNTSFKRLRCLLRWVSFKVLWPLPSLYHLGITDLYKWPKT